MHFSRIRRWVAVCLVAMVPVMGCRVNLDDFEDILNDLEITIDNSIDNSIQTEDPRGIDLPQDLDDRGDEVNVDVDVDVIVDVSEDLVYADLPDITLLAFENLTDFDIFIEYEVDGEPQGVFVLFGETLLLEYPCLFTVDLIAEDDFDPFTGEYDASYDLSSIFLDNPQDFECGEAVIFSITPFDVHVDSEIIDLYP